MSTNINIIERIEYRNAVYQSHDHESGYRSRACVDVIPIRFRPWKAYAKYNSVSRGYDIGEPTLVGGRIRTLKLRFSRERESGDARTKMERFARYKRVIDRSPHEANKLRCKLHRYVYNNVGISEAEHPHIVEQIMSLIQRADPRKIIDIQTLNLIFRVTLEQRLELLEHPLYKNKLIPATEPFIQALEEASPVDNDELQCAICMEMFAQKKDTCSITKLPCSHYYHRDCIVAWLHINHVCPTCRCPNAPAL